jgi:outer membrane PBP1 activator LpoA protein
MSNTLRRIMSFRCIHLRVRVRLLTVAALLYGGLWPIASTPARAQSTVPGVAAVDAPHIALLLPVDSSTFRRHAEALRDGFVAASKAHAQQTLPIRVYAVGDDPRQASQIYQQAEQTGARLVVGPLLRTAVNAITAGEVSVPTLVLNAPEGNVPNRPNLHVLSLQIETEARQAARLAHREGRRAAYIVAGDSPLLKRLHSAFAGEFTKLGGKLIAEFAYNTSPAELIRLKQAVELRVADMAFLALDARQARAVRTYLEPLAVYASSQIHAGDASLAAAVDLAGVVFLDMPWLLQRDHPAVMIYPRQDFRGEGDLERLYALGIDAWRIGQALLARQSGIVLDGVTGRLVQGLDRQFTRELVSARFGAPVAPAPVGPAAAVPAAIGPVAPGSASAGPIAPVSAPAPAASPKPAAPAKP